MKPIIEIRDITSIFADAEEAFGSYLLFERGLCYSLSLSPKLEIINEYHR